MSTTTKELSIFTYDGSVNPRTTRELDQVLDSANCESSAWKHVRELLELEEAAHLGSLELYYDRIHTQPVENNASHLRTGDIVGLCSKTQEDLANIHMGVALVEGEAVSVVHTARHIGKTIVQPLKEAQEYPGHAVLAWIRRPNVKGAVIAPAAKI